MKQLNKMKKTIGIIGAGNIGKTVAAHLVKNGYSVKIGNSKHPDSMNYPEAEPRGIDGK